MQCYEYELMHQAMRVELASQGRTEADALEIDDLLHRQNIRSMLDLRVFGARAIAMQVLVPTALAA